MRWLRTYWLWFIINIIAILPLIGLLNSFQVDFSNGGVPDITITQPVFPEREEIGGGENIAAPVEPREHTPSSFMVHVTGEWAIRWLVLCLSCTPLYILFGWRSWLSVKKALGLYAFMYGILHLLFFAAAEGWLAVFSEFNFVMGLLALLIMLPLALTSNRWSMQSLGKGWKLLHRAVYAAGIFAVLHLAFLGEGSAILYAVIIGIGLAIRVPQVRIWITHFRQTMFRRSPVPA